MDLLEWLMIAELRFESQRKLHVSRITFHDLTI